MDSAMNYICCNILAVKQCILFPRIEFGEADCYAACCLLLVIVFTRSDSQPTVSRSVTELVIYLSDTM